VRGTWSHVGKTYTLQHTYDRVLVKNCSRCWELADQVDTPRRSFSTRPFCSTASSQQQKQALAEGDNINERSRATDIN
jgi:hypothetical protein